MKKGGKIFDDVFILTFVEIPIGERKFRLSFDDQLAAHRSNQSENLFVEKNLVEEKRIDSKLEKINSKFSGENLSVDLKEEKRFLTLNFSSSRNLCRKLPRSRCSDRFESFRSNRKR